MPPGKSKHIIPVPAPTRALGDLGPERSRAPARRRRPSPCASRLARSRRTRRRPGARSRRGRARRPAPPRGGRSPPRAMPHRYTGVSIVPRSSISILPVSSPIPLTTAVAAGTGSVGGSTTVTPVGSPLSDCEWPTRTPRDVGDRVARPGLDAGRRGPAMSRQRSASRRTRRLRRWLRALLGIVQQAGRELVARRPAGSSGGSTLSQGSKRFGQRGWKRQPPGTSVASGSSPPSSSRPPPPPGRRAPGPRRPAPACTGAAGARSRRSARPCSTTRPRYMTAIRSHSDHARLRSWVMNSSASSRRFLSSSSTARICACTETSSIETGSSQISPSGSSTRAAAIATRWRWPPES